MIKSDQIRAARALLALDQSELAQRAHVSIATLRRVEGSGEKPKASIRAVKSIQHALEVAGAEFIDNGVRRRPRQRSPEEVAERVRKIKEISERSAKILAKYPGGFSEDDLYDENGLPA
jgi:transcriptional regulator with XRE-family HTH domain